MLQLASVGGGLRGQLGLQGVFAFAALAALAWLLVAWRMENPRYLSSYLLPVGVRDEAKAHLLTTLCDSRTFCRQSDVDMMRSKGLALGGTTENAVVFDGDEVVSPGGLRHTDEPVRHKMLDALGDLSLAGMPILGRYRGIRSGHATTNRLLRALFARPDAYEFIECKPSMLHSLPGAGVRESDLARLAA